MSQLDFLVVAAKSITELVHENCPYDSQREHSLSRCPRKCAQTVESVATEEWDNVIRRGIGARCVTHTCAYTPALSGITRSKISKSNISQYIIYL